MHKKGSAHFVVLLFTVLVVVMLLFIFLATRAPASVHNEYSLPEIGCNTHTYNSENAIDLVFFGSRELVDEYMDFFLNTPPFSSYPESFNAFYIDEQKECDVYRGIATLCHSKELIKEASVCPNDFIAVLTDAGDLRSSAYQGVASININHPKSVLTHEVGHIFISLDEEYTGAKASRDSRNCLSTCDQFNNPDGCYDGCSNNDLKRSIQSGVMRTLRSNDYGAHNLNEMEQWIVEITEESSVQLTGLAAGDLIDECSDKEFYYLETNLDTNEVKSSKHAGCPLLSPTKGASYDVVVTSDGSQISNYELNPYVYTEGPGEVIEGEVFEEPNIFITIPAEGDSLEIFDDEGSPVIETSLVGIGASPCII